MYYIELYCGQFHTTDEVANFVIRALYGYIKSTVHIMYVCCYSIAIHKRITEIFSKGVMQS